MWGGQGHWLCDALILRWLWVPLPCHSAVPKSSLDVMNFPEEETSILSSHGYLQKYLFLVGLLKILSQSPQSQEGIDVRRLQHGRAEKTFLGTNPETSLPLGPHPWVHQCRLWTVCFSPPSPPVPVGNQASETHTGGWDPHHMCGYPQLVYYILRAPWP